MNALCYVFQTNCFVHSFRAKDYIILTRYSKALSYDSNPKLYKTFHSALLLPLYFSKYLEQLGNRLAS